MLYIESTKDLKIRYRIHVNSFNKLKHKSSTVLAMCAYSLKLQNTNYTLPWTNMGVSPPYNTNTGKYRLFIK